MIIVHLHGKTKGKEKKKKKKKKRWGMGWRWRKFSFVFECLIQVIFISFYLRTEETAIRSPTRLFLFYSRTDDI